MAKVIISASGKCGTLSLKESFAKIADTKHTHSIWEEKEYVRSCASNEPVILIDSVRDIIDRKISSYFENIIHHLNMRSGIREKHKMEGIGFIREDFKKYFIGYEWYDNWSFLNWKDVFDYDVFALKFDTENRIQIYSAGNLYFVNLRFKDIKDWRDILRGSGLPIEGIERFELLHSNDSRGKWYCNIYDEFKRDFVLSQRDFDSIYKKHKNVLKHFQIDTEFKEKWFDKIRNDNGV